MTVWPVKRPAVIFSAHSEAGVAAVAAAAASVSVGTPSGFTCGKIRNVASWQSSAASAEGLLSHQANAAAAWQQAGRGRPAKRYRLTAAGRAKLEHTYDDLASAAIRQLRELGGDQAVQTFARRRIDAILAGVAQGPDDVESTAERVADAMTKAGYAATTTRVGGPMQGIQICQHHCPVSHVAEEFPELCEAEK